VLDELYENPVLATAAYNAGPGRAKSWLPDTAPVPTDLWVETIPFNETRKYVQSVMAYSVVYDYRLGNTVKPLMQRMPAVIAPR
jgi:soluble lytic murein transglycosylase